MAPASPARASSDYVTKVVYASADTSIAPDVGESRGDLPHIEVGGGSVGLLKFDLNGVIPPGAEVTNAYLALYLTDYTEGCELASSGGRSMVSPWTEDSLWPQARFNVRPITRPWTEHIQWGDAHEGIGPDVIGSFDVDTPPPPQRTGCDVTQFVVQWHSGQTSNHGLALTTESDDSFWFYSREGCQENADHLAIRYLPGPTPTPTIAGTPTATPRPSATPLPELHLFLAVIQMCAEAL